MLIVRKVNGTKIAVDPTKGSSVFLTQEDIKNSGIDLAICSLNDIEFYLKKDAEVVPFELTWELTNHCNLNCPFCYIHNHMHCKDITFDEAKKCMDEMISKGLIRVTLTGGECTLNKDFIKIYKYFKENGVLVDVYTNGVLLNDEIFEVFAELPPNRVEMTIYNSYDNEPRPYQNALRLKKQNINVLIKFTVATTTIQYFDFVKTWCEENHFKFKFDTDITDALDNSRTSVYQIDTEEKIRLDKLRVHNASPKSGMKCFSCGAGNVSFHINSHFGLGLCCRDEKRYSLLENSFEEAYAKMCETIMRFKYMPYGNCNNCFARPICRMCYLRCRKIENADGSIAIEAPIEFCEATRKYYKALFGE